MKKTLMAGLRIVAGALLIAAMLHVASGQAQARPGFPKIFMGKYPDLAAAKEAKCGVCHADPKDKKIRNDYGKAVEKALGEKKVTDAAKVEAALDAVAGQPSGTEGKTFGDLIKDGKLPGK